MKEWTQPHTWVHIDVKRPGGIEAWNGEGPPLQWAAARGWSVATLKPGEAVRLLVVAGRYFVVCFSSSKIVTNAPPGPPRPGARL